MERMNTVTRPAWVTAEAVRRRNTLWLTEESETRAWAVDTVRALLAREDIDAWDDFCDIVDAVRPAALHFGQWASANPERAADILSTHQRSGTQDFSEIDTLFRIDGVDFPANGGEAFARRWLRGSAVGAAIVLGLAPLEALEVDLVALDNSRIGESGPVTEMYGKQTAQQKRMRADAKAAGLNPRSSVDRWYTCCDWVECEHKHGGSVTKWLQAHGKDFELKGNASRRFAPLEQALGIRRKNRRL